MPKVSVIVPVYNLAGYIVNAISYLKGQTLTDWEAILVDDGSTDNSVALIKKYVKGDKRFRLVQQENAGAASARNHGLRLAKGETVIFLDGDDFYKPQLLEKAYARSVQFRAQICIFGFEEFDVYSQKLTTANYSPVWDKLGQVFAATDCADDIFRLTTHAPWSKLYRRDFLAEHDLWFDEAAGPTNDTYFTLLAQAMAQRITVVRESLVCYVQNRPGSYTRLYDEMVILDCVGTFEKLKTQLHRRGVDETFKRALANEFLASCRHRFSKCTPAAAQKLTQCLTEIFRDDAWDLADKSTDYFFQSEYYDFYQKIKTDRSLVKMGIWDRWKRFRIR